MNRRRAGKTIVRCDLPIATDKNTSLQSNLAVTVVDIGIPCLGIKMVTLQFYYLCSAIYGFFTVGPLIEERDSPILGPPNSPVETSQDP
jgi:hypothetical protein